MKIRIGFVSNSSSSSFVIIGSQITNGEAFAQAKELIAENRLYARAGEGWDGDDFFPISTAMWKSYAKYGGNNIYFYDVQFIAEDGVKIKKADIKGNEFSVFNMEVSYHSCETLSDFESKHLDMPEVKPKVDPKIAKKKKTIKRLKKELKDEGYDPNDLD